MKDFKDEKIIKIVREDSSYEIKTTSQAILQKFKARKTINQETNQKQSRFKFGLWTTSIVAFCGVAALFMVFLFNEETINPSITITNKNLENQLSAFSFFIGGEKNDNNLYKMPMKYLKSNNQNSQRDYFEKLVDAYDEYSLVMKNAFKEMKSEGTKYEKEIDGEYYKYLNKIYFVEEDTPFAELYFNDEKIFDDKFDDEGMTYKALYITEGEKFDLTLTKSQEREKDEIETYYSLLFINKSGSICYSVEKEQEIENRESEFAYSLTTYASKKDFENKNFVERVTYELETENGLEEAELLVEKEDKQYHFENIINKENQTEFEAFIENDDEDLDSLFITLIYQDNERIYKCDNFTYKK